MLNLCVENFENLGRWMGGWKEGRMEAKAGLRIAYSNQKRVERQEGLVLQSGATWPEMSRTK